jgi:transglycosylase-like protein
MRLRSVRIVVAASAMLAIGQFVIGSAGASSGGVGTTTSSGSPTKPGAGGQSATPAPRYERLWDSVSAAEKRWAHRTSECESGGNPEAIGGGGRYRGAFQFMLSTWKRAPKSPGGDPIAYAYRTQAVVAVMLMRRAGTDPWPVCG